MKESDFVNEWAAFQWRTTAELEQHWDARADSFVARTKKKSKDNEILSFFQSKKLDITDLNILDLGCGPGRHSVLFAQNGAASVTGLDISSRMIEHCRELARTEGVTNTEFHVGAWEDFDVDKHGWNRKFDLAFSAVSPAMSTVESLNKFLAVSKKYCYLSGFVTRYDSIHDYLVTNLGAAPGSRQEYNVYYIFNILWLRGINADIEYRDFTSERELTLDEACVIYGDKAPAHKRINASAEQIREYLKKMAHNGVLKVTEKKKQAILFWMV